MNNNQPMLSVCCNTYNHENYIREAIEGFLLQETNFPFEIIIHDDASTDNTAKIVKEYAERYPELFITIFQTENKYSKGIKPWPNYVFPLARGKYIALCEGDDYWTDPYKLQKQVDFLEKFKDYGLVHSDLDHYYVNRGLLVKKHWKSNGVNNQEGDIFNSLLLGETSMIYACTACFRSNFIQNDKAHDDFVMQNFVMGDLPLWLHIASKSKIGYISDSMAVRNVLPYSATQGRDFKYNIKFLDSAIHVVEYFSNIYPVPVEIKLRAINKYYERKMNTCFHFGEGIEIFDKCFSSLSTSCKNKYFKLKRFGLKYPVSYPFIRLLTKIIERLTRLINEVIK